MIPKKLIQSYLDEHWDKLSEHLEQYFRYQEPNDLHQLRVNIKKISALVQFLDHDQDAAQIKKVFEPVRKIFKAAGKIREIHIFLEITNQLELNHPWITKIFEKRKNRATMHFLRSKKKFLKAAKRGYTKYSKKITSYPDFVLKNFLITQIQSAQIQLSEQNYHETRKIIKVVLNLSNLLPKTQNTFLNIDYLDAAQKAIGDWHDADENYLVFEKLMLKTASLEILKKEADMHFALLKRQLKDFPHKVFNTTKTA